MSITSLLTHTASYIGIGKKRITDKALLPLCMLSLYKEEGNLSGLIAQITPPFSILVPPLSVKGSKRLRKVRPRSNGQTFRSRLCVFDTRY